MLTKGNEADISRIVVDCAFTVHKSLGPGLLESAYESCLAHELKKRGLLFEKQKPMPLVYDDILIDTGYRLDFVIEESIVLEIRSVEKLIPLYQAQLMTYLKLTGLKTGLLINFNSPLIKDGIKRISL